MPRKVKSDTSNKVRHSSADELSEFAKRIRYCADLLGSGKALAEASGIPASTISNYATDFSEPSRDNLIAIAKAANVNLAWLVSGEGEIRNGANISYPGLSERLMQCVRNAGSASTLAYKLGVSQFHFNAMLDGIGSPTDEQISKIAALSNVSVEWLKHGNESYAQEKSLATPRLAEPTRKGYSHNHSVKPTLKGDLIQIPVMSAVASAGHGAVVLKEEVHEFMALSSAMVRTLKLSADEAFIIYARGESMEPKIRGGEPLICSKAERHLKAGDGIYVVRLEGDILVKHVQRLPGGKVRIFSENTSYAPFEVTLNDGVDFAILGKVLHSIQQV